MYCIPAGSIWIESPSGILITGTDNIDEIPRAPLISARLRCLSKVNDEWYAHLESMVPSDDKGEVPTIILKWDGENWNNV